MYDAKFGFSKLLGVCFYVPITRENRSISMIAYFENLSTKRLSDTYQIKIHTLSDGKKFREFVSFNIESPYGVHVLDIG